MLRRQVVYDGWRVIMEVDSTGTQVNRAYTWGLDLSGTLDGAAGVGGLLALLDLGTPQAGDERTFLYFYDANGNVGQLVETTVAGDYAANYGSLAASYDYTPFGARLNEPEPPDTEYSQPFRFSTKPFHGDLGYWGHSIAR